MPKKSEKRIKKLKKRSVFGSVLECVCLALISVVAVIWIIMLSTSSLVSDQLVNAYSNALISGDMIKGRIEEGDEIEDIMAFMEKNGSLIDGAVILDRDMNRIAGFNDETLNLSNRMEARTLFANVKEIALDNNVRLKDGDFESSISIYADTESNGTLFSKGGHFNIIKAVRDSNLNVDKETKFIRREMNHYVYWIDMLSPEGDYHFLTKGTMIITVQDVIYTFAIALAVAILSVILLIALIRNAIANRRHNRQLNDLLNMDMVTGGRNRRYFINKSHEILKHSQRRIFRNTIPPAYAVVDMELVGFSLYCAGYGVVKGEELLEQIAGKLSEAIGRNEIVARYDEADFALLLECKDEQDGCERVEKLMEELSELQEGHKLVFRSGIRFVSTAYVEKSEKDGNAVSNALNTVVESGKDIASVFLPIQDKNNINSAELRNEACAARISKEAGNQNVLTVFDRKLLDDKLWEEKVKDYLDTAMENEEFKVYVQPKYDPVSEQLRGAEALIRWISPTEGFQPPGKFIPILEETGLVVKIDDYMLSHVAKLQAEWLAAGYQIVPVSVNVSRAHFTDVNLAEHIRDLVDVYQVPHEFIEIELTESAFFDDQKQILKTIGKLQEYGFEISMDDFGAGYSSLNSLKNLPLNVLKLDAEFFRGEEGITGGNSRADIVVGEAIRLAKSLNMKTVAEGIEEKAQVDILAKMGCDMIQGYYFSKPLPAEDYEKKMEKK